MIPSTARIAVIIIFVKEPEQFINSQFFKNRLPPVKHTCILTELQGYRVVYLQNYRITRLQDYRTTE